MKSAHCLLLFFFCAMASLIGPGGASAPSLAADTPADDAPPAPVVKVYDVSDLIYPPPKYPLVHESVAPLRKPPAPPAAVTVTHGLGGGGLFGGNPPALDPTLSPDTLVKTIEGAIAPDTWIDNGGRNSIQVLGNVLLVSQSADVQTKVDAFLAALRASTESTRTCAIEASWYWLEPRQLDRLLAVGPDRVAGEVDAAALDKLPASALFAQAEITCFGGQTTHVLSGRVRNVVYNVEAQVGTGAAAYQPDVEQQLAGAALQVTPHLGARMATVELIANVGGAPRRRPPAQVSSTNDTSAPVTRPTDPAWKSTSTAAATVDQSDHPAQELATAVRVPFGRTVLAGGMTIEPARADSDAGKAQDAPPDGVRQLYLFLHLEAR